MNNMIRKATVFEIVNHWILAASFFVLAISGFSFLFHLGLANSLFGGFNTMRTIHDWAGVVFSLSLFITIFYYLPISLVYTEEDIVWLLKGGGYLSKKAVMPPQDKLNAAQKGYYLFQLITGIAIAASGFAIWLTPGVSDMRKWILLSHLVHNIGFVLMVLTIPTHIYFATIANPGTLRIMLSGKVPIEWARKRHARWVQKLGL